MEPGDIVKAYSHLEPKPIVGVVLQISGRHVLIEEHSEDITRNKKHRLLEASRVFVIKRKMYVTNP